MSKPFPSTVLLAGPDGAFTAEVTLELQARGARVVRAHSLQDADIQEALGRDSVLEGLVLVTAAPEGGRALLDIDDAELDASTEGFLDLFGALRQAVPQLADGSAVVAIGSRGHLGAWGGAHEMAFAGATVGVMRSVALENMRRGVRANVVAAPLPEDRMGEDSARKVAELVAFLLSDASAAVNGELLLATEGRSLQIREARDRRRVTAS
jgi:NAD(P)-dependent dehydrogenase (short-subunit alcohol dehydrogenase family)